MRTIGTLALWLIFGGLAGWVATLFVGTDSSFGVVGNVLIGIAGAVIGGFIADALGASREAGIERPTSVISFVFAVLGAIILLVVLNLLFS